MARYKQSKSDFLAHIRYLVIYLGKILNILGVYQGDFPEFQTSRIKSYFQIVRQLLGAL